MLASNQIAPTAHQPLLALDVHLDFNLAMEIALLALSPIVLLVMLLLQHVPPAFQAIPSAMECVNFAILWVVHSAIPSIIV